MHLVKGGQKESGVVLMMKKRNENLTRQLEDARRERVAKEMAHLQEKKNIEDSFQKQLRLIQSEKEQLVYLLFYFSIKINLAKGAIVNVFSSGEYNEYDNA